MIKSCTIFSVIATLSIPINALALPGNAAEGKKLHNANCVSCHDDSVYKCQDRAVKNLEGLTQQINACGHAGNVTIGQPQANDLVKYLNETYYKFK